MTEVKYDLGNGYGILVNYDEYGITKITRECFESLIEKQIPIEPSEVNDEALKLDGIFDWCCGKCGTHHRNDFLLNYCSECGQAIKWK